jgi:DNA-damage-inducible protein J
MASTNITMRIDETIKSQLQDLLSNLGMDLTTYFTLAAKQAIREQALPFQPSLVKNNTLEKEKAFQMFGKIVNSKTISNSNIDYDAELASYRNEKYGK